MSSLSKSPLHVMANGLLLEATQVCKIGVLEDTLEQMILSLIKLQNLSNVVKILQIIALLLKNKISVAWQVFKSLRLYHWQKLKPVLP